VHWATYFNGRSGPWSRRGYFLSYAYIDQFADCFDRRDRYGVSSVCDFAYNYYADINFAKVVRCIGYIGSGSHYSKRIHYSTNKGHYVYQWDNGYCYDYGSFAYISRRWIHNSYTYRYFYNNYGRKHCAGVYGCSQQGFGYDLRRYHSQMVSELLSHEIAHPWFRVCRSKRQRR